MSTQSLLSILSKGQASRARSQASRHGLSPTFSFMPRSSSTSLHKNQIQNANSPQRSQQLFKVVHLLNVKLKQSYYYSFCRIEQIYKQSKKNTKIETLGPIQPSAYSYKDVSPEANQAHSSPEVQQVHVSPEVKQANHPHSLQAPDSIGQGIAKLIDFENTLSSKIQIRGQEPLIRNCFNIIRWHSSCIQGSIKIDKVWKAKTKEYNTKLIVGLRAIQKQKIRGQIALQSITCILTKNLVFPLQALRNWKPEPVEQILKNQSNSLQNIIQESQSEFGNQELSMSQEPNCREEVPCNSLQHKYLQAVKAKKIKLKQKKVAVANPVALAPLKFLKSRVKMPLMDTALDKQQSMQQPKNELMRRCLNLKSELFVNCIPDLSDNSNLFQQTPQLLQDSQVSTPTVTYEQSNLGQKNSLQLLPTDDCTTQRYLNYKSVHPGRRTPSICKHSSLGNIVPKQIFNDDNCPPLLKMEQLMLNINAYKSASKEKRTVNVNLPKNIYQTTVPISTFSKTPSKERRNEQAIFQSDNKENFVERLITQRAKQVNEKGGLEGNSAVKPKSTMLIRDRRTKMEKKELFTARKMKIQIENIINRRNKQIATKNEVRPLK